MGIFMLQPFTTVIYRTVVHVAGLNAHLREAGQLSRLTEIFICHNTLLTLCKDLSLKLKLIIKFCLAASVLKPVNHFR